MRTLTMIIEVGFLSDVWLTVLRDVIALCWYMPWLREGCQVRLAGSASMDGFVSSTWLLETC